MIEILDQFSYMSGQSIQLIAIILFILGIFQCFLGYRIFKFWIAVCGFTTFGILGGLITIFISGSAGVGIFFGFLFAIGGAYISFKIYKIGVFTLCALMGLSLAYILSQSITLSIFIGLLIGTLSQFFVKPVIIFSTSTSGGFTSAMSLLMILKIDSYLESIFLSVALAIGGVLVQLFSHKIKANENPRLPKINSAKPKQLRLGNTFSWYIKNKIEMDNSISAKQSIGLTFDEVCQNIIGILYSFNILKMILPFIDYILYFVSLAFISLSVFIFTKFILISSSTTILLLVGGLCFIKKKYIALAISFSLVTLSKLIILANSLSLLKHSEYTIPFDLIDIAIIGYIAFVSIKYFWKSEEGLVLKNKIQDLFQKRHHTDHITTRQPQSTNEIKIMIRCPNCSALNSETSKFCDSCGKILIIDKKTVYDAEKKNMHI